MVDRKALDKALDKHLDSFVELLEYFDKVSFKTHPVSPHVDLAQVVAAVALYRSSKRLETLSQALLILTFALVLFTIVLIWRTFVQP